MLPVSRLNIVAIHEWITKHKWKLTESNWCTQKKACLIATLYPTFTALEIKLDPPRWEDGDKPPEPWHTQVLSPYKAYYILWIQHDLLHVKQGCVWCTQWRNLLALPWRSLFLDVACVHGTRVNEISFTSSYKRMFPYTDSQEPHKCLATLRVGHLLRIAAQQGNTFWKCWYQFIYAPK